MAGALFRGVSRRPQAVSKRESGAAAPGSSDLLSLDSLLLREIVGKAPFSAGPP